MLLLRIISSARFFVSFQAKPQKRRVHSLEDSDNDVADEAIESASDNDDNASSAEEDPIENTQKDKPAARKRSRRTRR